MSIFNYSIVIDFPHGKILLESSNIDRLSQTTQKLCNALYGTFRKLGQDEDLDFKDSI